MANAEHVRYLDAGVDTWNNWRKNNPSVKPDLGGAPLASRSLQGINLSEADLRSALLLESDLHEANLNGADLSGAYLHESNLSRVRLQSARLENTDLSETNLLRANLTDANLSGAGLWGAVLARAKLDGTSFERATLAFTTFGDADLRKVKGLQSVDHAGPSFLDLATIVRSCGQIPEVFLRGCGVPEQFITYARSLVVQPIEFYSCFISYSSHDQVFAELLHADLRAKNLRCWFAPEDLKIGDHFQERIEESIQFFDKVIIVLSEASVRSRWVEREVNAAREREDRDKRAALFPIRIDDAVMNAPQPWATDIRRTRHIGDFRAWEAHSSYRKAFERLLRDLKAEKTAEAF